MRRKQLLPLAAIGCITAAALLYIASGHISSGQDGPSIDLALVQDLLQSSQQTSEYRLIPESVMTGLCWRTRDGIREGVFKDVNSGMAQWRDHAPETLADRPTASATSHGAVYAQLSRQLDQLSFHATGYSLTDRSAEVTGELVVGGHRREVIMKVKMPVQPISKFAQNIIELSASTELAADDLGGVLQTADSRALNLCITVQAVKGSVLPDSAGGKPLVLSHYYQ
jgi:hypothetical protein